MGCCSQVRSVQGHCPQAPILPALPKHFHVRQHGNLEAVRVILELGVDALAQTALGNNTPLHKVGFALDKVGLTQHEVGFALEKVGFTLHEVGFALDFILFF
jgi:hypothetical protein